MTYEFGALGMINLSIYALPLMIVTSELRNVILI